ncbi:MAG: hypothetical protein K0R66_978 [Gammaproteobacteria bacterium]|jgi:hypothetical protein|nr:hypothetical protein [Gammaproteobacteria bacterium]
MPSIRTDNALQTRIFVELLHPDLGVAAKQELVQSYLLGRHDLLLEQELEALRSRSRDISFFMLQRQLKGVTIHGGLSTISPYIDQCLAVNLIADINTDYDYLNYRAVDLGINDFINDVCSEIQRNVQLQSEEIVRAAFKGQVFKLMENFALSSLSRALLEQAYLEESEQSEAASLSQYYIKTTSELMQGAASREMLKSAYNRSQALGEFICLSMNHIEPHSGIEKTHHTIRHFCNIMLHIRSLQLGSDIAFLPDASSISSNLAGMLRLLKAGPHNENYIFLFNLIRDELRLLASNFPANLEFINAQLDVVIRDVDDLSELVSLYPEAAPPVRNLAILDQFKSEIRSIVDNFNPAGYPDQLIKLSRSLSKLAAIEYDHNLPMAISPIQLSNYLNRSGALLQSIRVLTYKDEANSPTNFNLEFPRIPILFNYLNPRYYLEAVHYYVGVRTFASWLGEDLYCKVAVDHRNLRMHTARAYYDIFPENQNMTRSEQQKRVRFESLLTHKSISQLTNPSFSLRIYGMDESYRHHPAMGLLMRNYLETGAKFTKLLSGIDYGLVITSTSNDRDNGHSLNYSTTPFPASIFYNHRLDDSQSQNMRTELCARVFDHIPDDQALYILQPESKWTSYNWLGKLSGSTHLSSTKLLWTYPLSTFNNLPIQEQFRDYSIAWNRFNQQLVDWRVTAGDYENLIFHGICVTLHQTNRKFYFFPQYREELRQYEKIHSVSSFTRTDQLVPFLHRLGVAQRLTSENHARFNQQLWLLLTTQDSPEICSLKQRVRLMALYSRLEVLATFLVSMRAFSSWEDGLISHNGLQTGLIDPICFQVANRSENNRVVHANLHNFSSIGKCVIDAIENGSIKHIESSLKQYFENLLKSSSPNYANTIFHNPVKGALITLTGSEHNLKYMAKFIANVNTIERMNILFYSSLLTGLSMIAALCYGFYNIHMNDYYIFIVIATAMMSFAQASQIYGAKVQELNDDLSPTRLVNARPYCYLALACFFASMLSTGTPINKDISSLNAGVFTGLTYAAALFFGEQLFRSCLHIKKRDIIAKAEKIELTERFNESIFAPVYLNSWLRRNPQAENRPHLE